MNEWSPEHLGRIVERLHLALVQRVNPAIRGIDDDRERQWALWFAIGELTAWQRTGYAVLTLAAGPLCGMVAASFIVGSIAAGGWLALMTGAVVGAIMTVAIIEAVRGPRIRRRVFRALRVLGHDVCLGCGYAMRGHGHDARRCPECGQPVPMPRG